MADPFIGEIRMFGFNFAPVGWMQCNGQLLPISQYAAVFSLLGTFYGGNGTTTFGLPNLQGRAPIHAGNNGTTTYTQGQATGVENVTLTTSQMPLHSHSVNAVSNSSANQVSPSGALPAKTAAAVTHPPADFPGIAAQAYSNATADSTMASATISSTGGSTPVHIVQPVLCVNFCIAVTGIFPSRN